jgi:primosomal protein N' (replication factor Y) (superfamily II helicase)
VRFNCAVIVRVSLELALRREYDYLITESLAAQITVGSRVRVPFGARKLIGFVTAILDESPHSGLRDVLEIVGKTGLLTPTVLRLGSWVSDYYCCAKETALSAMLPDAVRGPNSAWKERLHIYPGENPPSKISNRQRQVLKILEGRSCMALNQFAELAQTTTATLRRMEDKGLVRIAQATIERDPYANEVVVPTQSLQLNSEQQAALEAINRTLDKGSTSSEPGSFLLHGVTGSGKTEVYLQAISHALTQGKGAIVLVPEIALTPQTVERFKARFSSGPLRTTVAVLHSHLSSGERHDEWHKIREGRAKIVIGARSAVFAPVETLGLIIVDEEHEHSYKQEEAPRYNARDVAVVRAQMENAAVVLGSATPSMESLHNAKKGKYRLLEMPTRADDAKMPIVRVVDMRMVARKQKDQTVLSPQLKEAILKRLEQKEQVMLFLNRRGFATSMQCPKCGYIAQCPNCSISLTYHRAAQQLRCHICNHQSKAPSVCPETACGNPAIRLAGLGTEKVEATLAKIFPHARISRMDSDTLKRKEDYRRVLGDFRTGKIDILVGTQMIAKGLHFPNVTLVGIIHADLGLHVPDFRAGERTFQLLTQVAGRAGRGDIEGEVWIQAFTPFHPAIQYARRHDVLGFYEQEIEFREQLRYPPFARVALLTFKGRNEEKVEFTAKHFRKLLDPLLAEFTDLKLAGPAPAPLAKAESFHRFQIMLRAGQMSRLSRRLNEISLANPLPKDIRLVVDIDPMNLM